MIETSLSAPNAKADMRAVLGMGNVAQAMPSAYAPPPAEDVSVAGVMLLSAMSVCMAILAMVMLALMVMGGWWLVSHIPIPAVLLHILAKLGLATPS
jgi:hypothetical protein